ncbi:hypothetical protein GCM10010339_59930 [Streptomyces alanosinicus]|uniref:Type II toxin-antitoxin system RelE/ParE family toxin n=1 Tax=Streptomyces alanosinicus TaxID=68171 RepID=A0A918YNG7_9ACTN|nr:hypothetical protein GCM10010339_59930 [Streptomyces alanosinicus]
MTRRTGTSSAELGIDLRSHLRAETLTQAEKFAEGDPDRVRRVFTPVDRHADCAFGSADLLRIHIDRYRVMYAISDQQNRVSIIRLGRVRRATASDAPPAHPPAISVDQSVWVTSRCTRTVHLPSLRESAPGGLSRRIAESCGDGALVPTTHSPRRRR